MPARITHVTASWSRGARVPTSAMSVQLVIVRFAFKPVEKKLGSKEKLCAAHEIYLSNYFFLLIDSKKCTEYTKLCFQDESGGSYNYKHAEVGPRMQPHSHSMDKYGLRLIWHLHT
jgi:hypothetical protein